MAKSFLSEKIFQKTKAQKCIAILLNTIKHYCLECMNAEIELNSQQSNVLPSEAKL
jgi:hypothetical protein